MEFKIYNKGFTRRWLNWQDFIKSELSSNYTIKNENVVVFVTYNNSFDTLKLLDLFLNKEFRKDFDIIIVDNNSLEEYYNKIKDFVLLQNTRNITLLQTIDNLGGGGGYALGLEYILSRGYKFVIITEDDAFPLQKNTLSEMLKYNTSEVLIRYKELNTTSFSLHFHGYPIKIIEKRGVLDPRYFMRSDDLEWALGNNIVKKHLNISEKILDNFYYTHPVIKKGGNKFWQIYLGQRNSFFTESRWRFNIQTFIIAFLYIWFGFTKLFKNLDIRYIKYILLAYFDFIFIRFGYKKNKIILNQLFNEKDNFYNNVNFFKIKISEFNSKYGKYFLFSPSLNFLRNKIIFSKKINSFFEGNIVSGFNSPLYPISLLSKNIVSIEEIDGEDLIIVEYTNTGFYRFLAIFLSFIFGLITYTIIIPFLVFRYFLGKIFKI